MSDSLWGYGTDVASDQATIAATQSTTASAQATIAANKRWQSRLFTTSGTWTVPADVGCIWVDGCGGGNGGARGDPTPGGGGAGGGAAEGVVYGRFPVVAGESLTLTIGAAGIGQLIGSNNQYAVTGGFTHIVGSQCKFSLKYGAGSAIIGEPSAGGIAYQSAPRSGGRIFTNAGLTNANSSISAIGGFYVLTVPGNGGAVNVGAIASSETIPALMPAHPVSGSSSYVAGGTGGPLGGGGGGGACCSYGIGGLGGSNGAIGQSATGYGAGGGGGSGNAGGGNGSPGFIRIYCFSAATI